MIEPISVADTAARLTGPLIRCNHGVQYTQSVQWWSRGNVFRILSSIHCADTALWLDSVFLVRPKTFSSTNHLKSVSFEGYTLLFFIDQKPDLIWKYNIPSMPWFEDKDVCICERTLQQNLWHFSLQKTFVRHIRSVPKWNHVRSYPVPRWHWCSMASNLETRTRSPLHHTPWKPAPSNEQNITPCTKTIPICLQP